MFPDVDGEVGTQVVVEVAYDLLQASVRGCRGIPLVPQVVDDIDKIKRKMHRVLADLRARESIRDRVLCAAHNMHGGTFAETDGILAELEESRLLSITVIAGELNPRIGKSIVFAQLHHACNPIVSNSRGKSWSNAEGANHKSYFSY